MAVTFRAVLMQSGKTATGIAVPEDVVTALGSGKRVAVKATINGYTYRSSVAPYGGDFMLPVSAEIRAGAGVNAGDEFDVSLELDTEPRVVAVPADFAAALEKESGAKTFFEGLSYSNKSRFVLSVEGAKSEETRQRRIERSIEMLKEGKV